MTSIYIHVYARLGSFQNIFIHEVWFPKLIVFYSSIETDRIEIYSIQFYIQIYNQLYNRSIETSEAEQQPK